jgi:nucleoside-diphosphate-sugar epimerase
LSPLSKKKRKNKQFKPTHVLNAAGLTGRPNVDWCETHKVRRKKRIERREREKVRELFFGEKKRNKKAHLCSPSWLLPQPTKQIETIRANVLGMLNLADICNTAGVHLTTYATGCIFHYDDAFPEGSGKGFKEDDKPNFTGSYYSYTKAMVESLLKEYPNVLVLRVRMPIVGDLTYPRNFVAKILRYEKIVNIPNSMTVLPELLPMSIEMAKRGLTGEEFFVLVAPGRERRRERRERKREREKERGREEEGERGRERDRERERGRKRLRER